MFGKDVWPDDFFTHSKGQKVQMRDAEAPPTLPSDISPYVLSNNLVVFWRSFIPGLPNMARAELCRGLPGVLDQRRLLRQSVQQLCLRLGRRRLSRYAPQCRRCSCLRERFLRLTSWVFSGRWCGQQQVCGRGRRRGRGIRVAVSRGSGRPGRDVVL